VQGNSDLVDAAASVFDLQHSSASNEILAVLFHDRGVVKRS